MKRRLRVAVSGVNGRVGKALAEGLSGGHEVIPLTRREMDLADGASLRRALEGLDCEVFLNPAGLTSLEQCEDEPELAWRVNALAPAEIAAWATGKGVRMVHFSTDYVFDGRGGPALLGEGEPVAPLSGYGRSKAAGERAVCEAGAGHAVWRVSWVFGVEKPSFVDGVMAAARAGKALTAVADKQSLPTHTAELVEWMREFLERPGGGLFHACQGGTPASWHDLAGHVVERMAACGALAGVPPVARRSLAEAVAAGDFRASRPRFTAMDNRRLAAWTGVVPRDWREVLAEYVDAVCVP